MRITRKSSSSRQHDDKNDQEMSKRIHKSIIPMICGRLSPLLLLLLLSSHPSVNNVSNVHAFTGSGNIGLTTTIPTRSNGGKHTTVPFVVSKDFPITRKPQRNNQPFILQASSSSEDEKSINAEDILANIPANGDRATIIESILAEDDRKWRDERRARIKAEQLEIEMLEKAEEEGKDTEMVSLAKASGVTLTTVERIVPTESDEDNDEDDKRKGNPLEQSAKKKKKNGVMNEEGAMEYGENGSYFKASGTVGGMKGVKKINGMKKYGWFDDLDAEEEEEEEEDTLQIQAPSDTSKEDLKSASPNDSSSETTAAAAVTATDKPKPKKPKPIKKKSSQKGTQVGSAGGWSLEVFPGDFVVHRKYGIGRFEKTFCTTKTLKPKTPEFEAQLNRRKKLVRIAKNRNWDKHKLQKLVETFGTEADKDPVSHPRVTMLEVQYADGVVHVPIDKAYRLSRYRAGDAAIKPKLSKVRGDHWRKAREKVALSTAQLAEDVLALYATRETLSRTPFDPKHETKIVEFGNTFPYTPTADQVNCFETIENDMVWRRRPMDRLVCGDVGFGKTEVALRALYRCVANGRQAALLAPTGVLASQHYKTLMKRMGPDTPYNVSCCMLRGGMGESTKVGKQIRKEIASGHFQLIVGTHALLSKGVPYHNLGLLVVDEEQRFGVKQKERLKLICSGVDVLTLSATPIPRTLQMSLSGIRDTSTIRSPPPMRKPTVSIVDAFSDSIVEEAIRRELDRGGQCFYVLPRIAMLDEAMQMLNKLFPDMKVGMAHGRLPPGEAEKTVERFAEGDFKVLLATTVIENGVDIPTVNTIIIQNAQSYGMSTLYQLRGRVGRSDLQAFAYFLHNDVSLTEQATARLQAMAELHQLGSGFDVAARDLEIRGAGSLLGTEQSGMAERVGFDLYMRMLKKSIRQLRGLDLPNVPRTNILLPEGEGGLDNINIEGSAFSIPKSYIRNETERVQEEGTARLAESSAKLVEITKGWKEKYGKIPASLASKLKTLHLHACTRIMGVDLVGLIPMQTKSKTKSSEQTLQCILRSPGLRPRHWITIIQKLPSNKTPKNVHVYFPARFSHNKKTPVIFQGGKTLDLSKLSPSTQQKNLDDIAANESEDADGTDSSSHSSITSPSIIQELIKDDDEDWDALDEEEIEAWKEIASAVNLESMEDANVNDYPRFILSNVAGTDEGKRVDVLLKALLPLVNIISAKQAEDQDRAIMAADLREKREQVKRARKAEGRKSVSRNDYFY